MRQLPALHLYKNSGVRISKNMQYHKDKDVADSMLDKPMKHLASIPPMCTHKQARDIQACRGWVYKQRFRKRAKMSTQLSQFQMEKTCQSEGEGIFCYLQNLDSNKRNWILSSLAKNWQKRQLLCTAPYNLIYCIQEQSHFTHITKNYNKNIWAPLWQRPRIL